MRFARGFTLVEVLVTMLVISIGVGLVALNVSQVTDRRLDTRAIIISRWMESLSDRAILEGSVYGFRVVGDQLQAITWFDHQWLVVEHEGFLTLPENIQFRLGENQPSTGFVSEEELTEPEGEQVAGALFQEDNLIEALMVFMPSGEPMADGELLLQSSDEALIAILWSVDGSISYEDRLSI